MAVMIHRWYIQPEICDNIPAFFRVMNQTIQIHFFNEISFVFCSLTNCIEQERFFSLLNKTNWHIMRKWKIKSFFIISFFFSGFSKLRFSSWFFFPPCIKQFNGCSTKVIMNFVIRFDVIYPPEQDDDKERGFVRGTKWKKITKKNDENSNFPNHI